MSVVYGGTVALSFFFFQAEDGIRDLIVTGVQTCALPISRCRAARQCLGGSESRNRLSGGHPCGRFLLCRCVSRRMPKERRSEERRVGKSVDLGGRRIIKKKKKKQTSAYGCRRKEMSI